MTSQKIMKVTVAVGIIAIILLGVTFALTSITTAGTKRQVITTGELDIILDEDDAINLTNAMPVYDEVGMIGDAFNFRLINKTPISLAYTLKLVKVSTSNELSPEIVRYGLTKDGESTIDFLSTITDDIVDSGTISGNQTIEYSLRLWIDINVEDESLINGKTLSYRVDAEASDDTSSSEEHPIGEVKELAFSEENLGENCKTYNDGTDTFLVGQCSQNYVWYSGKLWRVVLKNNETGAVKMVTDNNMAAIDYNKRTGTNGSAQDTEFNNSYVDQWLNQEFLLTLHNYEDYLEENSVWDATTNNSSTPTRPNGTTKVKRTVGSLNSYEYYVTYGHSDGLATKYTNYLINNVYWWTLTPVSSSYVWNVKSDGNLDNGTGPAYSLRGVRPSINLKSNIQITSGEGTESNPYRLLADAKKIENGKTLLNIRYSGEYIIFNNELYRIVGTENNLTKIVAVKKPNTLLKNKFHSATDINNFSSASIKNDLENYYQGLESTVKNMIEPNAVWYLGTIGDGTNYKASICSTVDANTDTKTCVKTTSTTIANIGLPRLGEMFVSQIMKNAKENFWTLTSYNSSLVYYVQTDGYLNRRDPTNTYGARPSMYLKSNVVISKDNTGDGTYEHPYDIELGA